MQAVQPDIHLFQIAYSEASRAAIEPGYAMLDNLANPRPDWYEYWPIRRFLLEEPLDEAAFYGFFSPKFRFKTGLSAAQVRAFVTAAVNAAQADVVLFSPQPDMGAFFLNVFEQGETFDPGLIDTCSQLLEGIGRAVPLRELVMDSRQIVFSNYFVARPAFWREWLQLNEALFAVCEGPDSPLREALCLPTSYPAQRKVFVQERMASLLLATQPQWRSVAHDPFGFAWSQSKLQQHPTEAYISDALKLAWRTQPFPEYLRAFGSVREQMRAAPTPLPLLERGAAFQAVVQDYELVARIPSGHYNFGGNSVGFKSIVHHVFPERQGQVLSLLDIGFGLGDLGRLVKGHAPSAHWHVDGVDGYFDACCNAALFEQRIYRNVWYGLAGSIPKEELKRYDMLCLFDVIEHLDAAAAKALLASLLESLGPDSRLVLSTPLFFWPQDQHHPGDLEEHKIGVPAHSLLGLMPKAYHIGSQHLVGTFVLSRESLHYLDNFAPVETPAFTMEAGLQHLHELGLQADDTLYR
jgi:2-polyprenyl-3-methyl-5-hydroxy-6-metoxy-1,4-benzoquinol methylase